MQTNEKIESRDGDLVDQVFDQLVILLRERGVARAARLTDIALSEKLGVSRTPVRMALARLEGAGLIRKTPAGGWVQVPIRVEDVREIMELKAVLEPMLARKAAQNIDAVSADQLMATVREMEQAVKADDIRQWTEASRKNEAVLFRIAKNVRLVTYLGQLDDQWYRLRAAFDAMRARMPRSLEEHRAIAEAVVRGDADVAARLALEHVERMSESIMNFVRDVLVPLLGEEL